MRAIMLSVIFLFLTSLASCGGGGASPADNDIGGPATFVAPVASPVLVTSRFGFYVDRPPLLRNHYGVDLRTNDRSPPSVFASGAGTVLRASHTARGSNFGILVILDHGVHAGQYTYTLYAHLSSVTVDVDQQVEKGERIGFAGTTAGAWDNPIDDVDEHLHFEFVKSNTPLTWNDGVAWDSIADDYQRVGQLNVTGRVDPAYHVSGLEQWPGVGFGTTPPPPPQPGPGEFVPTDYEARSRSAGSEVWDFFIEWSESSGADYYEVVQYYNSDPDYFPTGGPTSVPVGTFTVISPRLNSSTRRFEWSIDFNSSPAGSYVFNLHATNGAGTTRATGNVGLQKR